MNGSDSMHVDIVVLTSSLPLFKSLCLGFLRASFVGTETEIKKYLLLLKT